MFEYDGYDKIYPFYLLIELSKDDKEYTARYNWGDLSATLSANKEPVFHTKLKRNQSFEASAPSQDAIDAAADAGYKFIGWAVTGKGYNGQIVNPSTQLTIYGEDLTLTAKWTRIQYKVTYSWTGLPEGASVSLPKDVSGLYAGDTVTIDSTYDNTSTTKVGHDTYTFSGWTVSPELTNSEMPASNVTASGTWTKTATDPTYTLSYSWTGLPEGASVSLPKDVSGLYAGDTVTIDSTYGNTSTTKVGHDTYTFSGWTVSPELTNSEMPASNVTASGTWTKTATDPTYTLSYSWTGLPEGASVSLPKDVSGLYAGDTVTIDSTYDNTSTTKVGHDTYTFSGWTVSPELNNSEMPASNVTASGTWTKTATDTFTVTWVNWNGDLLEKDEDVKYNSDPSYDGKSPTRPASGRYTYTFNGWTPALSPVTGDITYTATYKSTYHRPSTPTKPTVEIEDDDALGLNTTDHFAYIVGYGNGEVRPQNNITRAEVATIFFRLLTDDVRDENLTKTNRYSDVAATSWYNTAVSTLSSMGIITGYPDGTFRPNAAITRAEFAAIAARFDHDGDKTAAKFSDIASHWAKDEISIAYNNGWITGYPNGTFGPQRDITRAETMTLVNRVLNRQPETEDDLLPNMTVWTDNANPKAWYYLAVQEATNSHYYEFKTNSQYEKWTELRETRDWTQLEK